MKKNYLFLVLVTFMFASSALQAQCGSCSSTISNSNSGNQVVSSGQTLCVTSTGTLSGQITILAGGKLCNQGLVNSTNIWVAGGTLSNYGTMTLNNLYVSSAGTFTNYASLNADSFLVENNSAAYYNFGTQTNKAFAIADHASASNTGTITTIVLYDSIGTFINNGNIFVTNGFGTAYNSYFENNGNVTVTNDFANGNNSNFINNKNMVVHRDFYNGPTSNFTTHCMVTIGRDWYNSASITGPTSSCGGFNIAGNSLNSGTIGSSNTFIDICDAGRPASGFDASSGGVAATTTFCTCMNNCVTVGIKEINQSTLLKSFSLYPNPANTFVTAKFNAVNSGAVTIDIKDMVGRTIMTTHNQTTEGLNELQLNTSVLAEGTYILHVTDAEHRSVTGMFNIVK